MEIATSVTAKSFARHNPTFPPTDEKETNAAREQNCIENMHMARSEAPFPSIDSIRLFAK